MSGVVYKSSRLRAYLQFVAAILYYVVARSVSGHAAQVLAGDAWRPLVEKAVLVFLLLFGYAGMGLWIDRQMEPIGTQGFPFRPGWWREAAMGLATGWAIALACVLPMVIIGGIEISFSASKSDWGWLVADAAFFALWALVEEVAFRGYAFQSFIQAVGPVGATLGFAAIYAILQAIIPGSSHASFGVALAFSLLLSAVYLRTRALWLSWGLNFAWKASRALLFGLAISGVGSNSPVVQGNPMGPFWLTGGGYGLDGSWFACLVFIVALPLVFRMTSDLNFRYNVPVIIPGGIPVDLDAAARAQHEAAVGQAAPAAPALVQIQNVDPNAESGEQRNGNPD
jgi:hypothetical protein